MPRVCVIGGGPAGIRAALAGTEGGGEVTLFERLPRIPTPRSAWPTILVGQDSWEQQAESLLEEKGVVLKLGCKVTAIQEDRTVNTSFGTQHFDSVVLASGSAPVSTASIPRKQGVHVLESAESCIRLRESSLGYGRVLVSGGGPLALQVAGMLRLKGIQVAVSAPRGLLPGHFPQVIKDMLKKEADDMSITILEAPVRRIVGEGRVEAAIVGPQVIPCDGMVISPYFVPWTPILPICKGPTGGVPVGLRMETEVSGLFAAGGCAEYTLGGGTKAMTLESAAESSGWIAGTNAGGGNLERRPVACASFRLFGIEVRSAGFSLEEAESAGLKASEASICDDGAYCSVVFDSRSRRTFGIHLASRGGAPHISTLCLATAEGVLLDDLALLGTYGSTDITAVIETAREGIRAWRRS